MIRACLLREAQRLLVQARGLPTAPADDLADLTTERLRERCELKVQARLAADAGDIAGLSAEQLVERCEAGQWAADEPAFAPAAADQPGHPTDYGEAADLSC
jgi:hypothetical protein